MATPRPALGHARAQLHPGIPSGSRRPSRSRRLARGALVGTTAALAITALPGTAAADPAAATTPEQAAQLVADASHRLEVVTEQVNEAREVLGLQQLAAAAARQQVEATRTQLDALDGQIREVARSAYTGVRRQPGHARPADDQRLGRGLRQQPVDARPDRRPHHRRPRRGVRGRRARPSRRRPTPTPPQAAAQQTLDDLSAQEDRLQSDIADYQRQYDQLTRRPAAAGAGGAGGAHRAGRRARRGRAAGGEQLGRPGRRRHRAGPGRRRLRLGRRRAERVRLLGTDPVRLRRGRGEPAALQPHAVADGHAPSRGPSCSRAT